MVAGLVGRQLANMGRVVTEVEVVEEEPQEEIPAEIIASLDTGRVAPITWDF